MAGLHKHIDNDRPEHIKELKEQLQITEGELMAGNNNPDTLKELKGIFNVIISLGIISLVNIRKHLKPFE